jgi:ATP-dependent HslUV protease subunit HslV
LRAAQVLRNADRLAHSDSSGAPRWHATTILGVCRGGEVAIGGDGQVTFGDMIVKHGARKIRTLSDGAVVAGFAGAVADALTLFEKFEIQLRDNKGDLRRAAVELTKEWRTDRYLRRLEAQLIVADPEQIFVLSGEGDVLAPDDGIVSIGTGAPYAIAAAQALATHTKLTPAEIVAEAMKITAELCIFTNDHIVIETAKADAPVEEVVVAPEEPAKPAKRSRTPRKAAEA